MRVVESCPFREAVRAEGAAEVATCRLLHDLLGDGATAADRVRRDACEACCASPLPTAGRINSVLASLLSRATAEEAQAGPDTSKAADLHRWARQHLQVVPFLGPGRKGAAASWDRAASSVAVILPCHNYGHFLAEAIESVLAQSVRAAEVVVVDDASDDETGEVARRYRGAGVRYLRVEHRNVHRVRRAGLDATASEFVCFLDADDVLSPDYLARGLPFFARPDVGIVYSDVEWFGADERRSCYPEFDPDALELGNFLHAGSLVRRQAIEIADGFRDGGEPAIHADWYLWRRLAAAGWRAAKQPALYRYRRHRASMLHRAQAKRFDYYRRAALGEAEVTIFTPLSGRSRVWGAYRDWLQAQTWPRAQCRLSLLDTSGDAAFGRTVRRFLADSPYPDTRYRAQVVGEPGLADRPRKQYADGVRLACARIYNRMAREVVTPFVLVVEDDIIPPPDVIDLLLRGMGPTTAAVTAPYTTRFNDRYVVWDDRGTHLTPGEGYQEIGGSGFGCLLLRRGVLVGETFNFGYSEPPDYDHAFCRRLRAQGWTFKVAWPAPCRHLSAGKSEIRNPKSER